MPSRKDPRRIGMLISDGSDAATIDRVRAAATDEGAGLSFIALTDGGVTCSDGAHVDVDVALAETASMVFDLVVIAPSTRGAAQLARNAAGLDFVRRALVRVKVIGATAEAAALLRRVGVVVSEGVIAIDGPRGLSRFISAARKARVWHRAQQRRA